MSSSPRIHAVHNRYNRLLCVYISSDMYTYWTTILVKNVENKQTKLVSKAKHAPNDEMNSSFQ